MQCMHNVFTIPLEAVNKYFTFTCDFPVGGPTLGTRSKQRTTIRPIARERAGTDFGRSKNPSASFRSEGYLQNIRPGPDPV